jgi:oligoribonuclease (3'-5' exoribonuclease)
VSDTLYLSLDTETGGFGLDKSLLTIGLVLANSDFQIMDYHHFWVKPDDGVYKVTGQALSVNGINLHTHDSIATTERVVGTKLYELLSKWSDSGKTKLIPVGKQVAGDIAQIQKVISKGSWENFVSYRPLEVSSVAWFLQSIGLLPASNGGLSDLVKHYRVAEENFHDALGDARMTLAVLRAMKEHIQSELKQL